MTAGGVWGFLHFVLIPLVHTCDSPGFVRGGWGVTTSKTVSVAPHTVFASTSKPRGASLQREHMMAREGHPAALPPFACGLFFRPLPTVCVFVLLLFTMSANLHHERGNDSYRRGEFKEAGDHFSRAIQTEPRNFRLFTNRAACRCRQCPQQEQ